VLNLYFSIESLWFKVVPEKMRFVLVGGFNSVLSYFVFLGLYFLLNEHYGAAMVLQYVITVNWSIITMRYYVFRAKGNIGKEYAKAVPVYIFMILANYPWLYFFDKVLGVSAPISQPIFIVTSALATYLLLKYFSFRKER